MLNVNTGKLQQALTLCNQTKSQITSLNNCFYQWQLQQKTAQLTTDIQKLKQFYQGSIESYEGAEQAVSNVVDAIKSTMGKLNLKGEAETPDPPFWDFSQKTGAIYKRFHHTFSSNKSIQDYLNHGACLGIFGSIHALELKARKDMKYMNMEGRLSFGNLQASADAKVQLKNEEDKFDPELTLKGNINGSLGEIKAIAGFGTSYLHVDGEATGRVGAAKAEGELTINKEEFTAKGEVGVAALQGEVKGSFTIFGYKVTVTGEGELGSAGFGAEFSSKEGELEFGGKVSFLAGIGLKVKIDW